jgi:hypothetical protein
VPDPAPSLSTSLFLENAESLASRLDRHRTAEAMAMAIEARDLAATFRAFQTIAPPRDERVATIQRLFDLNRRALDYLSSRGSGGATGA